MNEVYLVMFRNRIELKQGGGGMQNRVSIYCAKLETDLRMMRSTFQKILLTSNLCSQANLFSPTRI